tara:strand:+ start:112 stop:360 length:249 start_codon:yes stop_codon:yes gene_type:complete
MKNIIIDNRKTNNRSTAEYGWIVTPRIEDDFKYTPTAYRCSICEAEPTPYASTSIVELIENNARAQLVALNALNEMEMEAVN